MTNPGTIFSRREAARLSGLSPKQLALLEQQRVIQPVCQRDLAYSWYNVLSVCIFALMRRFCDRETSVTITRNWNRYQTINYRYISRQWVIAIDSEHPHPIEMLKYSNQETGGKILRVVPKKLRQDFYWLTLGDSLQERPLQQTEAFYFIYLHNLFLQLIAGSKSDSLRKKIEILAKLTN